MFKAILELEGLQGGGKGVMPAKSTIMPLNLVTDKSRKNLLISGKLSFWEQQFDMVKDIFVLEFNFSGYVENVFLRSLFLAKYYLAVIFFQFKLCPFKHCSCPPNPIILSWCLLCMISTGLVIPCLRVRCLLSLSVGYMQITFVSKLCLSCKQKNSFWQTRKDVIKGR